MPVLRQAFADHKRLLVVGFAYVACVAGMAFCAGVPLREFLIAVPVWMSTILAPLLFVAVIVAWFLARAIVDAAVLSKNPRDFVRAAAAGFDQRCDAYFNGPVVVYGMVGLLVVMAVNFSLLGKSLIPYLVPHQWDPIFAAWDKAVHFGHYPHDILIPLVRGWGLHGVLDGAYQLWFLVTFSALVYCLFYEADIRRRMRFLWSYMLVWIIGGTAMAVIASSVGPIFFHGFYPGQPDPYTGILANLMGAAPGEQPAWAVKIMLLLLEMNRNDRMLDMNGISAMPSMHVCLSWLVALYAWSVSRVAGAAAFVFAAVIMTGSVYLGWHYAIDGYVGIALASAVWWACGRVRPRG